MQKEYWNNIVPNLLSQLSSYLVQNLNMEIEVSLHLLSTHPSSILCTAVYNTITALTSSGLQESSWNT